MLLRISIAMSEIKTYLYSARIKLLFIAAILLYVALSPFWVVSNDRGKLSSLFSDMSNSIVISGSLDFSSMIVIFYIPMVLVIFCFATMFISFFQFDLKAIRLFLDFGLILFLVSCLLIAIILKDFPNLFFLMAIYFWARMDMLKGSDINRVRLD